MLSEQSVSVLALHGKGSHPCCCCEPFTVLAHTHTCTHACVHTALSRERAAAVPELATHGTAAASGGLCPGPVGRRRGSSGSWDDGDGTLR